MTDVHSPATRSFNMSRIRNKNTKPELAVRSLLHQMGYRFRLHRRDLPGRPDIALPKHQAVIFVHGCYWHRHNCRFGRVVPQTRTSFWQQKFKANVERDRRNQIALRDQGWRVITIWECQLKDLGRLAEYLDKALTPADD